MFPLAVGEGILVLIRSLATLFTREALSKFTLAATGTFAGGAALESFNKSSKEICECLDIINQTLTDGLAGRDIETERLNRSLEGLGAKLKQEKSVLADFRDAAENLPEGNLGGRRSEISAAIGNQIRMRERNVTNLEQLQTGLEGQLGARRLERATEPGLRVVPADSTSPLEPTSARQGLAEFCEAFDAKMTDLLSAIDDMAARSAAAMEALVGKEAAAVRETPRAADDLIVPDDRLITGSLVPGAAGGGISILESADQAFDALDSTLEKVDKSMSKVFANMTLGGASAADALSQIFARLDTDNRDDHAG